jgi:hypothetical protein
LGVEADFVLKFVEVEFCGGGLFVVEEREGGTERCLGLGHEATLEGEFGLVGEDGDEVAGGEEGGVGLAESFGLFEKSHGGGDVEAIVKSGVVEEEIEVLVRGPAESRKAKFLSLAHQLHRNILQIDGRVSARPG